MMERKEKINKGYKVHSNKYDDYITSRKYWSKWLVKFIWGMKDEAYVNSLLSLLPDDFKGSLLDIPVGTAIFTYKKYGRMKNAEIVCMDYSSEMLDYAREKFAAMESDHIKCLEGDVGALPFNDNSFDIVLSMNGFHAFPDKTKAFNEVFRVLKPGGKLIGCFYIHGERRLTDWFINTFFVRTGTFTRPFMDKEEVEQTLRKRCSAVKIWNAKSIVCFECIK